MVKSLAGGSTALARSSASPSPGRLDFPRVQGSAPAMQDGMTGRLPALVDRCGHAVPDRRIVRARARRDPAT